MRFRATSQDGLIRWATVTVMMMVVNGMYNNIPINRYLKPDYNTSS